ncbi:MAG: amino acid carrier protein [Holosporales bacterium]|jgi:AGCS family alanine or glycine:cation symporter|nr:amino acid carrier protein [Holosporales bacterium]
MLGFINSFFECLTTIEQFFWSYIGFVILLACGIYLTISSKLFQFRVFFSFRKCIKELLTSKKKGPVKGVHPIKLYFASVSGMVGLGNIVGVITAITIGGPGALFWMLAACFPSMLVKYSEIYLGIRYRRANDSGGYDGGPMFYLKKAFKNKIIPGIASVLLCIYSIEVFQFDVVADTVVDVLGINHYIVIILLLSAVMYTALGGIKRLSQVCSILMPVFILLYTGTCLWVIICRADVLLDVIKTVFYSAFSGHAAVGGFSGSTVMLAIQEGISRSVYSGDIGIGYDSVIQSETQATLPERQARLAIFSLFTDVVICSLSTLVVLVTGIWTTHMAPSLYVSTAFAQFIPGAQFFMATFLVIAGFTTIVAFLAVGLKCARFLSEKYGKPVYLTVAVFSFIFFSFFEQEKALLMMSISAGFLVLLNVSGIIRLRKFIRFR